MNNSKRPTIGSIKVKSTANLMSSSRYGHTPHNGAETSRKRSSVEPDLDKYDPANYNQYMCEKLSQYLEDLQGLGSDVRKLRATKILNIPFLKIRTSSGSRTHTPNRVIRTGLKNPNNSASRDNIKRAIKAQKYSQPTSPLHDSPCNPSTLSSLPGIPKLFSVKTLRAAINGKPPLSARRSANPIKKSDVNISNGHGGQNIKIMHPAYQTLGPTKKIIYRTTKEKKAAVAIK